MLLADVIDNACERSEKLRRTTNLRFDKTSFHEILGSYQRALVECESFAREHYHFIGSHSSSTQLDFNFRIKPELDRLTDLLDIHNAKIQFLLEPLEFDLLNRIYHEVLQIRDDVAWIKKRLCGRVIDKFDPDSRKELSHDLKLPLEVPSALSEEFARQAEIDKPPADDNSGFPFSAAVEALLFHFNHSTKEFSKTGGRRDERTPPDQSYINLLKSIWILQQLEVHPKLTNPSRNLNSHWPSYITELRRWVEEECRRFRIGGLVCPEISGCECDDDDGCDDDNEENPGCSCPPVRAELFELCRIWPKPLKRRMLPEVHSNIGMMNSLMEAQLHHGTDSRTHVMQLFRCTETLMKLIWNASEGSGLSARVEHFQFDFNIHTMKLIPLYANRKPAEPDKVFSFRLYNEINHIDLPFCSLTDALRFQRAVTGYEVYKVYSEMEVTSAMILEGQSGAINHRACIQFWIPRELKGKASAPPVEEPAARPSNFALPLRSLESFVSAGATQTATKSDRWRLPITFRRPSTGSSSSKSSSASTARPLNSSPERIQTLPPQRKSSVASSNDKSGSFGSTRYPNDENDDFPISPTTSFPSRRPTADFNHPLSGYPPDLASHRQSQVPYDAASLGRASHRRSVANSNVGVQNRPASVAPSRALSLAQSVKSIDHGNGTTGFLHTDPRNPLLVILMTSIPPEELAGPRSFGDNPRSGDAFLRIEITDRTKPNHSSCSCSSSKGASCQYAVIENVENERPFEGILYHSSSGESGWDISRLAADRIPQLSSRANGSSSNRVPLLPGVEKIMLQRLSLVFRTPMRRAEFSGHPCECTTDSTTSNKVTAGNLVHCLENNHQGLFGWVRESQRQQREIWRDAQSLVPGLVMDALPEDCE